MVGVLFQLSITLPYQLWHLPYPTLPYGTYPTLPYGTYPTLPYPTLPYPTLWHLPYLSLFAVIQAVLRHTTPFTVGGT